MDDSIEAYILRHSDAEGELLGQLNRETHVKHLRPRMLSGHLQGRILKMLCRMIAPKRILELGTFTGYSALCMAEALPPDGEIHTVEIDDEIEDFARTYFDRSPYRDRIYFHIGDALEVVPRLEGLFDLVFIDADKRRYTDYYRLVFDRVRPGGFILADNTLWDGKVAAASPSTDAQTNGILRFNELVASDDRVEKVILPLRDGLTLIWKK
ncbi:MAG: class I SAM-dependent methyltransferase [Coprobacter sp.]|nr:class I SAM-dependent methyltransferase [Coprobacter sp.]